MRLVTFLIFTFFTVNAYSCVDLSIDALSMDEFIVEMGFENVDKQKTIGVLVRENVQTESSITGAFGLYLDSIKNILFVKLASKQHCVRFEITKREIINQIWTGDQVSVEVRGELVASRNSTLNPNMIKVFKLIIKEMKTHPLKFISFHTATYQSSNHFFVTVKKPNEKHSIILNSIRPNHQPRIYLTESTPNKSTECIVNKILENPLLLSWGKEGLVIDSESKIKFITNNCQEYLNNKNIDNVLSKFLSEYWRINTNYSDRENLLMLPAMSQHYLNKKINLPINPLLFFKEN